MQLYAVPTVLVIYYLFIIRNRRRERDRVAAFAVSCTDSKILDSFKNFPGYPSPPPWVSLSLTTCIKQCNFKLFFPLLFHLQLLVALTLTLASDSPRAKQHSQSVLFLLLFLLPPILLDLSLPHEVFPSLLFAAMLLLRWLRC